MNQKEIQYLIKETTFNVASTGLTYRAINHYQSIGVIRDSRQSSNGWRKFSALDIIWIRIIIELRKFGLPLDKLASVYQKVHKENQLGHIDQAQFINQSFEEEIANSILNDYRLYFLVFDDCSYTFHDSLSTNQWMVENYKDQPHVNIPLYRHIKEIWKEIPKGKKST